MRELYIKDIISNLSSYREILSIINYKKLEQQLEEIDEIISLLNSSREKGIKELVSIDEEKENINTKKKREKMSFVEVTELWKQKKFDKIKGTKLDYHHFNDNSKIIAFVKNKSKEDVLKATSLVDLNLLYYILTGDYKEIKKKKEELYDMITVFVKANSQGEAFSKLIKER